MNNAASMIPELAMDVGMCGAGLMDSSLEPVTVAVMIIIAIL